MTDEPIPPNDDELVPEAVPINEAERMWCFTMVMAEVTLTCELGLQIRRIQFVSRSDGDTFPRSRLQQIHQLAAQNVITELKEESKGAIQKIEVQAVYLLGTIHLGWMTEDYFLGAQCDLISASEMPPAHTDPLPEGDNVVQLRPAE